MRMDFVRTHYQALTPASVADLRRQFAELADLANDWFTEEGVPTDRRNIKAAIDLRYAGQAYELTVPLRDATGAASHDELVAAFVTAHRDRYGYVVDNEKIQITAVRAEAFETLHFDHEPARKPVREGAGAPTGYREILDIYDMKTYRTPVYAKTELPQDVEIVGPCVIEQMDTTIHILRGQRATVDRHGNVIVAAG